MVRKGGETLYKKAALILVSYNTGLSFYGRQKKICQKPLIIMNFISLIGFLKPVRKSVLYS